MIWKLCKQKEKFAKIHGKLNFSKNDMLFFYLYLQYNTVLWNVFILYGYKLKTNIKIGWITIFYYFSKNVDEILEGNVCKLLLGKYGAMKSLNIISMK